MSVEETVEQFIATEKSLKKILGAVQKLDAAQTTLSAAEKSLAEAEKRNVSAVLQTVESLTDTQKDLVAIRSELGELTSALKDLTFSLTNTVDKIDPVALRTQLQKLQDDNAASKRTTTGLLLVLTVCAILGVFGIVPL